MLSPTSLKFPPFPVILNTLLYQFLSKLFHTRDFYQLQSLFCHVEWWGLPVAWLLSCTEHYHLSLSIPTIHTHSHMETPPFFVSLCPATCFDVLIPRLPVKIPSHLSHFRSPTISHPDCDTSLLLLINRFVLPFLCRYLKPFYG